MPPRASSRAKPAPRSTSKSASKKATSKPASKPKSSSKDKVDKEPPKPTTSKAKGKPASNSKPPPKDEDKPSPPPKVNGTKRGASDQPKKEAVKKRRIGAAINPLTASLGSQGLSVFVWGNGESGQFGTGPDDHDDKTRPQLNRWFEEQRAAGELGPAPGEGGIEIAAVGGMHNLAVDGRGQLRSWGVNDGAQLGRITADVPDPNNPPDGTIPSELLEHWPYVCDTLQTDNFRPVKVAAGDNVSVAVNGTGDLRAWGAFRSNEGHLGFDGVPGHPQYQFRPMALPALERVEVADVACGTDHVLALTTDGCVYVWGNSQMGQLGRRVMARRPLNALEPERLGLRNIVLVGAGSYTSFAVDNTGKVYGWGQNVFTQVGINNGEETIATPTEVKALHPSEHNGARVIQISGGEHHTLFLFDDGSVWGCGRQDAHELGICDDHPAQEGLKERKEEIRIKREKALEQRQADLDYLENDAKATDEEKAVARNGVAIAEATLRMPHDEYVPEVIRVCFPKSPAEYGDVPELGDYTDEVINPIVSISCNGRTSAAVSRSGWVYTWGLGTSNQLGLGETEEVETPTLCRSKQLKPYDGLSIHAGGQHMLLLAKKRAAPADE